jgi:hypothetical protein
VTKEVIWTLRAHYAAVISQMKIYDAYASITFHQNILLSHVVVMNAKCMQLFQGRFNPAVDSMIVRMYALEPFGEDLQSL